MSPTSRQRRPRLWIRVAVAVAGLLWVTILLVHARHAATSRNDKVTATYTTDFPVPPGSPMLPIRAHLAAGKFVTAIAYSPDGSQLAIATIVSDPHNTDLENTMGTGKVIPTVQLRGIADQKVLREFSGAKDSVHSLAFSRDGKTLAGGSGVGDDRSLDGEILLWDAGSARLLRRITKNVHCFPHVVFSPVDNLLASANVRVQLWNPETGEILHTLEIASPGDEASRNVKFQSPPALASVAFFPDGRQITAAGTDGIVRIYSVNTGQLQAQLKKHNKAAFFAAVTPDGTPVTAGWGWDHGGSVCDTIWWDVASASPKSRVTAHTRIEGLAVSPDGRYVATSGGMLSAELVLWNARTSTPVWSLNPGDGNRRRIESIAFSPDSQTLAIITYENGVELLSLDTVRSPDHAPSSGSAHR